MGVVKEGIDEYGYGHPPDDCMSINCPHLVGNHCTQKGIDFDNPPLVMLECIQYRHNYEHNYRKNSLY